MSDRVNAASSSCDSSAVPPRPFQPRCSKSRKISNVARTSVGERSFAMSTTPSALNRLQSCRSFFAVEPERLRSASLPRNARGCSESVIICAPRAFSAAIVARKVPEPPSSSLSWITFGSVAFCAIASKNAGITASACTGSITGLDTNAYS